MVIAGAMLVQPVREQLQQAYQTVLQSLESLDDEQAATDLVRLSPAADWIDAWGLDEFMAAMLPGVPVSLEDLQRDFDRVLVDYPDALTVPGISAAQFQALRRYLANKYRIAHNVAGALIQTAYVLGNSEGVDPQLLLAIIAIESRYNPFAESHVGAQGLMQVMPRVHRDKFEDLGLDMAAAVIPVPNMIVGTRIYTDCRRRRGSVTRALACYVGATGPGDGGYGAKVLAEQRRIAYAVGMASSPD